MAKEIVNRVKKSGIMTIDFDDLLVPNIFELDLDKITGIRADRNARQKTYVPVKEEYKFPTPTIARKSQRPNLTKDGLQNN